MLWEKAEVGSMSAIYLVGGEAAGCFTHLASLPPTSGMSAPEEAEWITAYKTLVI